MKNLNVTRLEFEGIKDNLKIFLQSQDELSDYNFSHSSMNIILDALSYATHYNALYAKQALNETFLDTALIRSSVVSRAKELNYIPRQYTPSRVEVDISITVPNTDISTEFIIPKYTRFNGDKNGATIPFVTNNQYTLTTRVGDVYSGTIILYQGVTYYDEYTFSSNEMGALSLTPENVWTDSIVVEVLPFSGASTKTIFSPLESIITATSESNIYFWEENYDGDIEIKFGDGVLGTALESGNVIEITSIYTLGAEGNGTTSFNAAQTINGISLSSIVVTNTLPSKYGTDRESIDSIKLLAPKNYAAQDRLVTVQDFKAYIPKIFGNIESLAVWNGKDNVPPSFGRVFVSIKPLDSNTLSQFEKDSIQELIEDRIVVGTVVEFADPSIINVNLDVEVIYNSLTTTISLEDALSKVSNAVTDFFSNNANAFEEDLIYSNLLTAIDNSTKAVNGNIVTVNLDKTFIPRTGPSSYVFDFVNEGNTVTSSPTAKSAPYNFPAYPRKS